MPRFNFPMQSTQEWATFSGAYRHDEIPDCFRLKVVSIWQSAFGHDPRDRYVSSLFGVIVESLCCEYDKVQLTDRDEDAFEAVKNFMLASTETGEVLDVIELTFGVLDRMVRHNQSSFLDATQAPDEAIAKLNAGFREHALGYHYESGQIFRIESQLHYKAVVGPAIRSLKAKESLGARAAFFSAHTHYRKKQHRECVSDCLKAVEATIESVCKRNGREYRAVNRTESLCKALGEDETGASEVSESFAAYAMHLAATTIASVVRS